VICTNKLRAVLNYLYLQLSVVNKFFYYCFFYCVYSLIPSYISMKSVKFSKVSSNTVNEVSLK